MNSLGLLRFLPDFLRNRLANRPNLIKCLVNTSWLFGGNVFRMLVSLLIGVWVARYLGPDQFGLLSFAIAFTALFSSFSTLGLNSVVVRDLVNEPCLTSVSMGTSFMLRVLGGFLACFLAVIAIYFLRPEDENMQLIVSILSISIIFKSMDVVKYWFEAQVQSKYVVWIENSILIILASIKVALILTDASLIYFVWMFVLEATMLAIGFLLLYAHRVGKLAEWSIQKKRVIQLLRDSWPLLLSGLAIVIYMRVDQIMLGQISGDRAVGIYSAAVRISEVWYFVAMSVVASVFPTIIKLKKENEEQYLISLQKLYDLMVVLALVFAIPMTFLSDWVINLLFGAEYVDAGLILSIHIWAAVFVFLGVASGKWLLLEGLQKHSLYRTFTGLGVNIVLNMLLIPKYGGIGAAVATVIAQLFAAYIYSLFFASTRRMFLMKTESLFLFRWYKRV